MEAVTSVKEYFDRLGERFVADKASGVNTVVQYVLAGDAGGAYAVHVTDGAMNVTEGENEEAKVTIKMKDEDFVNMVNGKLKGQMAYMQGKLKVSGNIPIAMKMQNIFPPSK
ncbi:MAG: putative sterol carrier protein [Myxococcota bacterium]|jgi:putative sterol carrier protein